MARPPFVPDPHQRRVIARLMRDADLRESEDRRFSESLRAAKEEGIPIEHIARAAQVTVKTVYNRLAKVPESLARTADTDQGIDPSP